MNAVGIDVSKGKSNVTILQPRDKVLLKPCDFIHTKSSIKTLIDTIKGLEGETKACMEHTGRYYEPRQAILCLYDCRSKQVPSDILWASQAVPFISFY